MNKTVKKIQLAKPDLSGNEEKYITEAISSSWISSTGCYVDSFEQNFAKLCETRTAISVCNGTMALHLALMGLDVRPGDEIITPSLTYVATANAVRYVNAEPVFIDVDPNTWCLDPYLLEDSITRRTKGIIAVHLYGHPADMDAINHLAAVYGLWVIEDAAEAHFAQYKNRKVGGLSSIGTFSFYGNKIITCGEGGAVTLNDPQLEIRLRALRGQGVDPKRRYYFPITGYNYRLTNLASAILCAQLERYDDLLQRRQEIFSLYHEQLKGLPGIDFQPVAVWAKPAPWLFCIIVDEKQYGHSRDELIAFLATHNVETRPFFIPLHTLPPFRNESKQRNEFLPITDNLSQTGLNLPTYSDLKNEEVCYITDLIRKYHSQH